MKALKKYLIDIAAVVLFVVISFAYFFPADIDGRILYRHDSSAGRGAGIEMSQYTQKTGEVTRWTNSLFSGMPTYQMAPSYKSGSVLNQAEKAYHLWLPENVWFLFAYLLGFYILLRAFDFRKSLAVLGSVIWAFSSYFLIIIAAGHLWKVMALAYLPPMMAGVVLAFRGKLIPGFIITAIFTAFEVNANHVQMTYYYLFIILFMVIAYLVTAIREKTLKQFWKAVGVCAAAAIMGIISAFVTPSGPGAVLGNVLGGLFIEIPLALMLYRKWTWWSFLISAATFGLINGFLYIKLLKVATGAAYPAVTITIAVASALVGGGVTILLTHLLNRAGVGIDHRVKSRA